MKDAGQGDYTQDSEPETIEGIAARLLAEGYGYGSNWNSEWVELGTEGENFLAARADAYTIAREGGPIEPAGHLWNQDDPDEGHRKWLDKLPCADRAAVEAWNRSHDLRGGADHDRRPREHEQWDQVIAWACIPHAAHGTRSVVALADAARKGARPRLTPLHEATLRLYALQDDAHARTVIRHAVCAGHRREAVEDALRRLLFPRKHVQPTLRQRALQLRVRTENYSREVWGALRLLEHWLHDASVSFVRAHGHVPRTWIPPKTLAAVMPKRSRPRFDADGLDTWWQPAAVMELQGADAARHCERRPAQPHGNVYGGNRTLNQSEIDRRIARGHSRKLSAETIAADHQVEREQAILDELAEPWRTVYLEQKADEREPKTPRQGLIDKGEATVLADTLPSRAA